MTPNMFTFLFAVHLHDHRMTYEYIVDELFWSRHMKVCDSFIENVLNSIHVCIWNVCVCTLKSEWVIPYVCSYQKWNVSYQPWRAWQHMKISVLEHFGTILLKLSLITHLHTLKHTYFTQRHTLLHSQITKYLINVDWWLSIETFLFGDTDTFYRPIISANVMALKWFFVHSNTCVLNIQFTYFIDWMIDFFLQTYAFENSRSFFSQTIGKKISNSMFGSKHVYKCFLFFRT